MYTSLALGAYAFCGVSLNRPCGTNQIIGNCPAYKFKETAQVHPNLFFLFWRWGLGTHHASPSSWQLGVQEFSIFSGVRLCVLQCYMEMLCCHCGMNMM